MTLHTISPNNTYATLLIKTSLCDSMNDYDNVINGDRYINYGDKYIGDNYNGQSDVINYKLDSNNYNYSDFRDNYFNDDVKDDGSSNDSYNCIDKCDNDGSFRDISNVITMTPATMTTTSKTTTATAAASTMTTTTTTATAASSLPSLFRARKKANLGSLIWT